VNPLFQLLIAAALIAVMALLRVFSYGRVDRSRKQCDPGKAGCDETECFHGCSGAASLGKTRLKSGEPR